MLSFIQKHCICYPTAHLVWWLLRKLHETAVTTNVSFLVYNIYSQCRFNSNFRALTRHISIKNPLTQWLGEDRKTHRVGFADLTEYRVRDKSRRVSRKVTEYSHILTEYLTELFHRVHWVRFKFLFSHRVFGRKLTEFTEFTRSRVFSPSSRPSEFPRVTVPGGFYGGP